MTAVLAFAIGGLVVLATGHNPLLAYRDIIQGAGLNWLAHPWDVNTAHTAPYNLSQTLLQTTTLILTGLAVAFAFRCGLFNIGGQGQYFMGLFVASWVGTSFVNMTRPAHILLGVGAAALAGAAWAAIAGFLKAAVGAHEVITTIMSTGSRTGSGATSSSRAGRSRARRTSRSTSRSPPTSLTVRSCPCSGATPISRACTSASSSRSPR